MDNAENLKIWYIDGSVYVICSVKTVRNRIFLKSISYFHKSLHWTIKY
jgi:hypothetical protein